MLFSEYKSALPQIPRSFTSFLRQQPAGPNGVSTHIHDDDVAPPLYKSQHRRHSIRPLSSSLYFFKRIFSFSFYLGGILSSTWCLFSDCVNLYITRHDAQNLNWIFLSFFLLKYHLLWRQPMTTQEATGLYIFNGEDREILVLNLNQESSNSK